MFDYLQQFNKLPKELRERVSSPAAMELLSSLEKKYSLSLAMVVMQVMIKQITIKNLPNHFISEMGVSADKAQALSQELQEKIFFAVSTYLGIKSIAPVNPEDKELATLMKDNGIILPSDDLMSRCRQILLTYRKGVRTKIDTRAALERSVASGGLGLDTAAADRLLRALERPTVAATPMMPAASAALSELINKNEAVAYDLKAALASGQIKAPAALADKYKQPVAALDPSHELDAPDKELALEAPEKVLAIEAPDTQLPATTNISKQTIAPAPVPVKPVTVQPIPIIQPQTPTPVPTPAPISTPKMASQPSPVKAVPPVITKPTENVVSVSQTADVVADLKPALSAEAPFKKSGSDKVGLWSKLFKGKSAKPTAGALAAHAVIASSNLEAAVKVAALANSMTARPAASSEARQKMEDVKARPKVMGPLEELRYLDLVNFRRLGSNPKEITGKIVMKIRLLEKDGYDRMVEGVKSWRQSPVNRIYIRLVQEAVSKDVTLRDAVAARLSEKKETLTMEEIEAIVAMNSQLMF